MKSKLFHEFAACVFAITLGGCATPSNPLSNQDSPGVRYVLKTVKKAERKSPAPASNQSDEKVDTRLVHLGDLTCAVLIIAVLVGDGSIIC